MAVSAAEVPVVRTAADLATREVPRVGPATLVGEVREALFGASFDSATDVAVCAGEALVGLVPLERLLAASPDQTIADLARVPATVGSTADREAAAWHAARSQEGTVAVVDDRGAFAGLIPAKRLLRVLAAEHEEDLARLGGLLTSTSLARSASEEAIPRRLWHRLPWLILGLVGAMASAGIVASFEEQLEAEVLLAFFVPAVVYMADAVGTQTETVVIRGLSVGVPIRDIVRREIVTGAVIGLLIATVFVVFAQVFWNRFDVAATVALALLVSSSVATGLAMALPYLLTRLGRDPAFGSGPLATVIQDLLSIVVYFAIGIVLID